MDRASAILRSAEQTFDQHGFTASGMDLLAQAAQVSSRTLYKHAGSKVDLVVAVLDARAERFFSWFGGSRVTELFDRLETWIGTEGSRGCLFLRAQGEDCGDIPEVHEAVARYRTRLVELVATAVTHDLGARSDTPAEQILVLFEGATAAAGYRGRDAVRAARAAATTVMEAHAPATAAAPPLRQERP